MRDGERSLTAFYPDGEIEKSRVADLLWILDAECYRQDLQITDFFVQAGHNIQKEVVMVCFRCPVQKECLTWAYKRNCPAGYFGGLSPRTRQSLTLEEASQKVDRDRERFRRDNSQRALPLTVT